MKRIFSLFLIIVLLIMLSSTVYAKSITQITASLEATKDKAIIIIPGFAGSSLKVVNGSIAWYASNATYLTACTETGTSIRNISTYAAGSSTYGVGNMFEDMYTSLYEEFGNEYDIIFYPYDWRMSNTVSANGLSNFVNSLGYTEIIFVTHSMGGLVASSYLSNSQNRAKVDKLITLGTPYLGCPTILYALETGNFFPYNLNTMNEGFGEVITNFPSAYQLLPPSNKFISYVISGDATLGGYSATTNYITNRPWAKTENNTIKPMFSTANTFHNSLMINGSHVTELSSVEVYRLFGTGTDTISKVVYDANGNFLYTIRQNNGDGTVLSTSATYNSSVKPVKSFVVSHIDMVQSQNVINSIIQCINGNVERSANSVVEVNDRGWLIGADNKRITITIDGNGSFSELLNNTNIYTSNGIQVMQENNRLYINLSDGTTTEVGTIWQAGNEALELSLYNGGYSFTFDFDPEYIIVEYSDSGYYEKVVKYTFTESVPVSLSVSDYENKDILCIISSDIFSSTYRQQYISGDELPESQLADYKDPNK